MPMRTLLYNRCRDPGKKSFKTKATFKSRGPLTKLIEEWPSEPATMLYGRYGMISGYDIKDTYAQ